MVCLLQGGSQYYLAARIHCSSLALLCPALLFEIENSKFLFSDFGVYVVLSVRMSLPVYVALSVALLSVSRTSDVTNLLNLWQYKVGGTQLIRSRGLPLKLRLMNDSAFLSKFHSCK